MKIIILKSNLKSGLDTVGRSVGQTANLPALATVLLEANGDSITLSGTNLELAIKKTVFGKVIEPGSAAVSFATLSSIVNNISSERINLDTKGPNLIIKTDNYEAQIQGVDTKEFPIIPAIKEKKEFLELKSEDLAEAFKKTTPAVQVSDLRPEISGVLFALEPTSLKVVGTDSFRLAEFSVSGSEIKNNFNKGLMITIPLKAAQEMSRIVEGEDNLVRFYTDEAQALFETESTSLVTRLIEGKFPDYEAIVPKETETTVVVSREELVSGLKLANTFSGRGGEVVLKTQGKKTLEILSSDSSVGENKYLIPAKIEGEDAEVVFNGQFLLDGIKGETSKDVTLGLSGEERPALIKSPGSTNHFYILMPIRS